MSQLLVVAGFLKNAKGEFLIAKRPEDKPFAGYWEFPGGKIQGIETPEEALLRELREELDLSLSLSHFKPLTFISEPHQNFHLVMILYEVFIENQKPNALEGQELAWVNFENIQDYQLLPADWPMVETLKKIYQ